MARPNRNNIAAQVDDWNAAHEVGTPVVVRKDDGKDHRGKTTSEAQVLGGHSAVIWVEGIRGCYLLDCVRPDATVNA